MGDIKTIVRLVQPPHSSRVNGQIIRFLKWREEWNERGRGKQRICLEREKQHCKMAQSRPCKPHSQTTDVTASSFHHTSLPHSFHSVTVSGYAPLQNHTNQPLPPSVMQETFHNPINSPSIRDPSSIFIFPAE